MPDNDQVFDDSMQCLQCAYSLKGHTIPTVCPECGTYIDQIVLSGVMLCEEHGLSMKRRWSVLCKEILLAPSSTIQRIDARSHIPLQPRAQLLLAGFLVYTLVLLCAVGVQFIERSVISISEGALASYVITREFQWIPYLILSTHSETVPALLLWVGCTVACSILWRRSGLRNAAISAVAACSPIGASAALFFVSFNLLLRRAPATIIHLSPYFQLTLFLVITLFCLRFVWYCAFPRSRSIKAQF